MAKGYNASVLQFRGDIIDSDATTVLTESVPCGLKFLSGNRDDQPQLTNAVTTHVVVMRTPDCTTVKPAAGYIQIAGTLYAIDFPVDAYTKGLAPRPGMWTEINCRVVENPA
jgi:hypothetical protein